MNIECGRATRRNETEHLAEQASVLNKGMSRLKQLVRQLVPQSGTHEPSEEVPKKEHVWSIGIYSGRSPFSFECASNVDNPVLTRDDVSDVRASFVADPFMLNVQGVWYMFFEVFNRDTGRGEIGLATSKNGFTWKYQQIVLTESFHLSYPYVFEWKGEYYMIPESHQMRDVRLYKASRFPTDWTCGEILLSGQMFSDSSIFRFDEKWWLFCETNPDYKHDTLRLYYAAGLSSPWQEHPKSPIRNGDPHIARPAGRVLVLQDRIIRYAQDCYPSYGTTVRAFEITELTTTAYKEHQSQNMILNPSGVGWNESGMHHIDPHLMDNGHWIACVDGRLEVDSQ